MKRIKIRELLEIPPSGQEVNAKGWVRTKRGSKNVAFIALNDGSTIKNLQVVVDLAQIPEEQIREVSTGACISATGNLVASQGGQQSVELQTTKLEIYGAADPEAYPLQPKKHTLEFLREIAHLRPRTNTLSAVFRIRHAVAFAIHQYFNDKGFYYMHTPIITGSDAEGAGEMFRVSTLDPLNPPKNEEGGVDFKKDFFAKETNLTVSGQLEAEIGAMSLGEVYTFGPTFRAENSNTTRHLAEFWMIEPEMAFYDLKDNMDLAEDFLKYIISYTLEHCADDLEFLHNRSLNEEKDIPKEQRSALSLLERLKFVVENDFARVDYTEAIRILENSKPHKKGKFQYPVSWGVDMQSEHERFLVEKHFKCPVIVVNYPKDIKAFYMKQNEDGKTVGAMDILFPGIGEIVGGSQREESYDKLVQRMKEMDVPEEELWWYLELRKFGTAPHSGFGLGFERMLLFLTGMKNIRDVIPFPRYPESADF